MFDLLVWLPISLICSLCSCFFFWPIAFCSGLCAIGGGAGVLVSGYAFVGGVLWIFGGLVGVAIGTCAVMLVIPIMICFSPVITPFFSILMGVAVLVIGTILIIIGGFVFGASLCIAGAGAIGLIASLCCLAGGGVTAVCSLICAISLCLPFASCCAVDWWLSLWAIGIVCISFPFWWLAMCPLTCWFGIPLYLGLSAPFCCIIPPCCFSIPYIVHYGTHICCGIGVCNLIDMWILGIITLNCTLGEIVSLGGWLCCPPCVCLPCIPFCFSGLMLNTKCLYMFCSLPYTIYFDVCCYLPSVFILLSGWAVEIFCIPFCMFFFTPLACLSILNWAGCCSIVSIFSLCLGLSSMLTFSGCCICQWIGCLGCSFTGAGGLGLTTCLTACSGLGLSYCCFCSSCLACPSFSGLGLTCLGLAEKFGGLTFKGGFTALGCPTETAELAGCCNSLLVDPALILTMGGEILQFFLGLIIDIANAVFAFIASFNPA